MKLFKKYNALLAFLLLSMVQAHAQKENYNWYFGKNAGISFNTIPPTVLTDGKLVTNEGCATISDINGNLLFYTDGRIIYNRNHDIMPNGSGLNGHSSSTQSCIVVPKPGSLHLYYIFTVDALESNTNHGLCYTVVNMKLDNGLGDVVTSEKNVGLLQSIKEKIIATPHQNRTDYWVLTYDLQAMQYKVFLFTPQNIKLHKTYSPGINRPSYNLGYLKCSPDGKFLANAFYSSDMLDLLSFDNSTGEILHLKSFEQGVAYGTEFSPNSKFLYCSGTYTYQYNLQNYDTARVGGYSSLGALQLAPDGKIYRAKITTDYLDIITNPNEAGILCNYQTDALYLMGKKCLFGLPAFISFSINPDFTYGNFCYGDSTSFSSRNIDSMVTVLWKFNDPGASMDTSTKHNPFHKFSAPGDFDVYMIININGISDTVKQKITIQPSPEPMQQALIRLCPGDTAVINAGNAGANYLWSSGQTTQTITVNDSGLYFVEITMAGCSRPDSVEVQVKDSVWISLGNDSTFCGNTEVILDAGSGADDYLWSTNEKTNTITVTTPGNYSVIKSKDGCTGTDEIEVSFYSYQELPLTQMFICESENETATLIAEKGVNYAWSPNGETSASITVLEPGGYTVNITDSNGCSNTQLFLIESRCGHTIYIPNVFKPNSSVNMNNHFRATGTNIADFRMQIYNRWGEHIYSAEDIEAGWDGTYHQKACPEGAYIYIVYYSTPAGNSFHRYQLYGTFTLLR